ncbi:BTAD domain-containing putative transcriptional regulator [Micromonospora sp. NPDC005806]|uniref:AfsR/SARP family transcriptional regulator n=1 Tax=Micromonospora sp. NPDC005806 TaxID=3364234 RepID=UPI00369E7FAB
MLGGFDIVRGASPVTLAPTAQRLVAFLAIHGPTARTQAAGTLWQSRRDDRAMAILRTTLWRLDQVAPCLLQRRDGVLAIPLEVEIDTRRFTAGAVDEAFLSDYIGRGCPPLLPGWENDWVLISRERLHHRYLRMLENAASTALCAGDPGSALRWATAAVSADSLRESAHRLVLAAFLADGRIAEARRQADVVRRLLAERLSVQPSAQLAALIRQARDRPAE